jgi:hypothetical protein
MESSSEDEFMSLLFGTRTSPALHQFLVSSLGEAALKRIAKAVDSAGRELRVVVSEHLQVSHFQLMSQSLPFFFVLLWVMGILEFVLCKLGNFIFFFFCYTWYYHILSE